MATTIKFKSIWYSFFQAQNSMLIQKSIKHVDKFDDNRNKKGTAAATDSIEFDTNESNSGTSTPLSDDYRLKRERNNESVRKSRAKSRVKLQECASRVQELRQENTVLNDKLSNLQSELFTLRGLFKHCFTLNTNNMPIKPNEIPTSTLYKLVMQNQSKLGIGAQAQPTQPMLQSSATILPITNTLTTTASSPSFFLANSQDTQSDSNINLTNTPIIQEPNPNDEEFYINELKNVLMSSVSSPELPVSPQSIEEQQAPLLSNELASLLGGEDMLVSSDQLTFLNDFDADISSSNASYTINDPLLSSPLTSDESDMITENLVMLDHDYTMRKASSQYN